MTTPRQPQDRQKKAKKSDPRFSFVADDGETYTFLKDTSDVITPGYARKNRHRSNEDAFFTLLEEMCDEDTLEKFDNLSPKEFTRLQEELEAHLGATRGESSAS